jgi:hypothetical protein
MASASCLQLGTPDNDRSSVPCVWFFGFIDFLSSFFLLVRGHDLRLSVPVVLRGPEGQTTPGASRPRYSQVRPAERLLLKEVLVAKK